MQPWNNMQLTLSQQIDKLFSKSQSTDDSQSSVKANILISHSFTCWAAASNPQKNPKICEAKSSTFFRPFQQCRSTRKKIPLETCAPKVNLLSRTNLGQTDWLLRFISKSFASIVRVAVRNVLFFFLPCRARHDSSDGRSRLHTIRTQLKRSHSWGKQETTVSGMSSSEWP